MGIGITIAVVALWMTGRLLAIRGRGFEAMAVWSLLPASAVLYLIWPLPTGGEHLVVIALAYAFGWVVTGAVVFMRVLVMRD